ncbi:helix-turn-helix domain-containing protein [Hymenobacter sp. NST-14]|uniref:helix-turn-helix domain-containing protein n=1 Tax=Hymenobacter piscis TaxID=2839984 RepID=UPI001C00F40A|nr:helix-turn-helix domain-containing protein [Hymenobacter piscis]MBT9395342.1 helix-turn-helix domain-containing protein [Hymenobacter piscis]
MAKRNASFLDETLRSLVEKIDEPFQAFIEQTLERLVQEHFAKCPKPDPQYTVQEVARLLCLDSNTVRSYLKKPLGHIRRLPFVECTDTSRGRRIRLSDVQAWQQRNLIDTLNQAEQREFDEKLVAIGLRRARRRAGRKGS